MKVVGSRYALYINRRYSRTGTLWEGRRRSSLVHSQRYLLTCMRYIELNPVRARMVVSPQGYSWSSYAANASGVTTCICPHGEYEALGGTSEERCRAYRELIQDELPEQDVQHIRQATYYCQPVGDERFRERIKKQYGIRLGYMSPGRPRTDPDRLPKK